MLEHACRHPLLRGGGTYAGARVAESREAFFATSDTVSVHVRLKLATQGIIPAKDLAAKAPRALFPNTSRAGLVAPGSLEAEIARERIHAAVDAFETEPLTHPAHLLLTHGNNLPSPHLD